MLASLSIAIGILIAPNLGRIACASPITYDFSGNFVETSYSGNNPSTFSGSFTINADATIGSGGLVSEGGSDVSITVNAGGQVFSFVNTPQNPNAATFTAVELTGIQAPLGPPVIEASLFGDIPSINPTITFSMVIYSLGETSLLSNLSNLNYYPSNSSVSIQNNTPGSNRGTGGSGSIKSIELVSTPEPSMLAVFGVLGVAAAVRRKLGLIGGN